MIAQWGGGDNDGTHERNEEEGGWGGYVEGGEEVDVLREQDSFCGGTSYHGSRVRSRRGSRCASML